MARMYSHKKGKSGSKKPINVKKRTWISLDSKEVESIVVKLSKLGNTSSQIGIMLRDSYGIPDVKTLTTKSVGKILEENKVKQELPEDLNALIRKEVNLTKHLEKNKHDQPAKRGLRLTESKVRRLVKYYKRTCKFSQDWRYDKEKAGLLIG